MEHGTPKDFKDADVVSMMVNYDVKRADDNDPKGRKKTRILALGDQSKLEFTKAETE